MGLSKADETRPGASPGLAWPVPGSIVLVALALLPGGETTLKTFHREKDGSIRLWPNDLPHDPARLKAWAAAALQLR